MGCQMASAQISRFQNRESGGVDTLCNMTTDADIAREYTARPITDISGPLGVHEEDLLPYGREIAKVHQRALERPRNASLNPEPKLVLVSAITPTPAGEGKTTTSIGLAQAMHHLGENVCLALREPSLGPCMGIKGGACGGGHSQVMPMDRINLHFTGDLHAVTAANNVLAALLDNHLHFGNELEIDPRRVVWRRVMDMNDRTLRDIVVGLGGTGNGIPREDGFDITVASEVMAALCLADGLDDLRARLERLIVGFTRENKPVTAGDLGAVGAMLVLLRDALQPNLVQTLEGAPAFIHGGPFANIAHGCNSVTATKMAMHHANWAITEAGFGADLGAEKFFHIKCRQTGLDPAAVVLVATVRALKMHGGVSKDDLTTPNPEAVRLGLANLDKHIENIQGFGKPPVVAINRFADDADEELAVIRAHCELKGVSVAESRHFGEGGKGAVELAKAVMTAVETPAPAWTPLYALEDDPHAKIRTLAKKVYGAKDVAFTSAAERDLKRISDLGFDNLPICVAKVPGSLSDDPTLPGRPEGFTVTVRNVTVNAGAGFLVVLTGAIMRMPGLPRLPRAAGMDLDADGEILGLD